MSDLDEMSQAVRGDLPASDFVFPDERLFPIQDIDQAMTALTYSTWPKNKKYAKRVREVVFKRYPSLRNKFKDGVYAKKRKRKRKPKTESMGSLGDMGHIRERLSAVGQIVAEAESIRRRDPDSVAQMFADVDEEVSFGQADAIAEKVAAHAMKLVKKEGLRPKGSLESHIAGSVSDLLRRFAE